MIAMKATELNAQVQLTTRNLHWQPEATYYAKGTAASDQRPQLVDLEYRPGDCPGAY